MSSSDHVQICQRCQKCNLCCAAGYRGKDEEVFAQGCFSLLTSMIQCT